ncbi:MAG: oligosaccharide flippase family protein [Candidatus Pacebacteria bacterium]|nr:oligosaccharide flippase family protein [Candidatus Paceibacterota bacterium]
MNKEAPPLTLKLQRILKTDIHYLAKGGFWLVVGQIVSLFSLLFLSMFFAKKLPLETYGTYKYTLSLIGIFSSVSLTGIITAVIQSTARGFEGFFLKSSKIYLKWSLPFFVLTVGGAIYYYIQGNMIIAGSLTVGAILNPILQSFNFYSSFLSGRKDFKTNAFLSILKNVFITVILITVLFTTKNIFILIVAYFLSHTTFNACAYIYTITKYKPNKNLDGGELTYTKHLSLMNILGTISMYIDSVLIFHFLGATQLAIYSFAVLIPEQIKGLLKVLTNLALPKYSKNSLTAIKKTILYKMFIFGFFIIFIIFVYNLAAPTIYHLLFPEYKSSILYSQIFAFSLIGIINILPMSALQGHGLIKELYKINMFFSLSKIVLLIILTPLYGIWGVILSISIVRLLVPIVSYMLLYKKS